MIAGSFRTPVVPNALAGLEVGYTWLTLDSDKLAGGHSGSAFSGGDDLSFFPVRGGIVFYP